jgi:hypothetical protein
MQAAAERGGPERLAQARECLAVRAVELGKRPVARLHVVRVRARGQRDEDLAEHFPRLDLRGVSVPLQLGRVDERPAEPGTHLVLEHLPGPLELCLLHRQPPQPVCVRYECNQRNLSYSFFQGKCGTGDSSRVKQGWNEAGYLSRPGAVGKRGGGRRVEEVG